MLTLTLESERGINFLLSCQSVMLRNNKFHWNRAYSFGGSFLLKIFLLSNLHATFYWKSSYISNICRGAQENGLLKNWGILLLVPSLGPRLISLLCLKQFTLMFPTSQKSALTIRIFSLFGWNLSNSLVKPNPTLTGESCFLINTQGLYHLH